jgi:hypothetical protein
MQDNFAVNAFSIDNLPKLKTFRSYMASSYDKAGGNYDFGNYEFVDGGEAIMLDVDGPGVITRIWSANPEGTIKIYLDGSEKPQVDEDFNGFLARLPLAYGNGSGMGASIKRDVKDTAFGRTTYCPIPFNSRIRITVTPHPGLYYQINYHLFDHEESIQSFDPSNIADLDSTKKSFIWDKNSLDKSLIFEQGTMSLAPGERKTLFDKNGQLEINYLSFEVDYPNDDIQARHIMESLLLRGYWDGNAENPEQGLNRKASIKSPLAAFFLDYGTKDDTNTILINKTGNKYSCRFPMPVKERALLEIINKSCLSVNEIKYEIGYKMLESFDENMGYFHALYHAEDSTYGHDLGNYRDKVMYLVSDDNNSYPVLKTWGRGHFIGCSFIADISETPFQRAMCESDEAVFVDDDPARTMWGTGNEDYVNDAWGFHKVFDKISGGKYENGVMMGYRFHISDCIPFSKKLRFTLEHGSSNNCTASYRSVAYYYLADIGPDEFIDGVPQRRVTNFWKA